VRNWKGNFALPFPLQTKSLLRHLISYSFRRARARLLLVFLFRTLLSCFLRKKASISSLPFPDTRRKGLLQPVGLPQKKRAPPPPLIPDSKFLLLEKLLEAAGKKEKRERARPILFPSYCLYELWTSGPETG